MMAITLHKTPGHKTHAQNPWAQTRQQPPFNDHHLNPPYYEPRMLQAPLNVARDDSGDAMTIDATSNSGSTADSVCSFESTRDIREFIREFNGRSYNAQNTVYFLPAGQSEFEPFILRPCVCSLIFPPHAFPRRVFHSRPSPPCTDKVEYSRLYVPYVTPFAFFSVPYIVARSATSNIYAIAFVLTSSTHTLIWLTSSYDLNSVFRRRFSI